MGLIDDTEKMIGLQREAYEIEILPEYNHTREVISNNTQLYRDEIRRLHVEFD